MKQKLALFVLYYLRFFAKCQLKKNLFGHIIGVTGSAGKTSSMSAIYSVLQSKYKVKASFKANSESGIPLDILGLEMRDFSILDWLRVLLLAPVKLLSNWQAFDYYIVEMGIDSPHAPKNMAFLLSIIQPKSAVFLGVGINHGFAFDHLVSADDPEERRRQITQSIAAEKARLVLSLPKSGFAYLNLDDPFVTESTQSTQAKVRSFGGKTGFDLQFIELKHQINHEHVESDFTFKLRSNDNKENSLTIRLQNVMLASHYAQSLGPAILIGLDAGLSLATIKETLEKNFRLPLGRASTIKGINKSLIIDSSYNASAMQDMIELTAQIKVKGRKLALLGDMRELGAMTKASHENIAKLASQHFEHIYLVGQAMHDYALPLLAKNPQLTVRHFANSREAGKYIASLLAPDDLILVKGSQNTIFLEEAVKEMMLEKDKAKSLLCRQSAWWQQVKQLNVA